MINSNRYDIIFINEHHRNTPLPSNFAPGYDFFYSELENSNKGGAMIAIKKEFMAIQPFREMNDRDNQLIKIFIKGIHVFAYSFYINPNQEKY